MSSKLPAPALAALLMLAAITPEPALAKRHATSHRAYPHGYAYQPQADDLNRGIPPGGSSPLSRLAPRPGRPFETDPDLRIRFEMNRDDRDRRLGGS
jgi:hypothetical protein